jgi:hypothetical protein
MAASEANLAMISAAAAPQSGCSAIAAAKAPPTMPGKTSQGASAEIRRQQLARHRGTVHAPAERSGGCILPDSP